jgi:hypothetical protein
MAVVDVVPIPTTRDKSSDRLCTRCACPDFRRGVKAIAYHLMPEHAAKSLGLLPSPENPEP